MKFLDYLIRPRITLFVMLYIKLVPDFPFSDQLHLIIIAFDIPFPTKHIKGFIKDRQRPLPQCLLCSSNTISCDYGIVQLFY